MATTRSAPEPEPSRLDQLVLPESVYRLRAAVIPLKDVRLLEAIRSLYVLQCRIRGIEKGLNVKHEDRCGLPFRLTNEGDTVAERDVKSYFSERPATGEITLRAVQPTSPDEINTLKADFRRICPAVDEQLRSLGGIPEELESYSVRSAGTTAWLIERDGDVSFFRD